MRSIQESIAGPENRLKSLTLSGGGARSVLWAQIFSDVFQTEVIVLENAEEVGLTGAVLLCGRALGWYSGYRLPPQLLKVKRKYTPNPGNTQRYDELYAIFLQLAHALRKSWTALKVYRDKGY